MRKFLTAAMLVLSSLAAQAQNNPLSEVPPEEIDNRVRLAGDTLHVCFDLASVGRAFDQDVAQAIADALFLKMEVLEGFGGFPLSGGGFMTELTIAMTESCDLLMGVSVSPYSATSQAFSISRPYATVPFVLVVANKDWQKLGDIPKTERLGTAIASIGEMNYITWARQQPKEERWVRLPYADYDLMTTRLLDGTIAGMILWQPAFAKVQREREDAKDLRIIANDPIPPAATRVGAAVASKNSFLRSQIDQAIEALVADGTIDKLIEKHGYIGAHAGE
ncbi:hypothetical protein GCM10023174_25180 [Chelativorans composti]|jgi:ABC-type amino acid transport/signal transduction systems, periplasmic component/domain|uniref:Substrate-binding periplasmic protein n=1 Tax=Chelativorans composti TaxID=768533 RepID=A0ABW5DJC8_9HYPH